MGCRMTTLTVTTKYGRRLTYSRSQRSRAFYRSPIPETLVSVAAHRLASAPPCSCRIRDPETGFYYCVGAYGGCERFESKYKGLRYA
jgi:hypothetical protein